MEKIEPNIELSIKNFSEYNESVTQETKPDGSFVTRYDFEGKIHLKKDVIEKLEKGYKDRWILLDGKRYNSYKPSYNVKDLETNDGTMVRMIMVRTVGNQF